MFPLLSWEGEIPVGGGGVVLKNLDSQRKIRGTKIWIRNTILLLQKYALYETNDGVWRGGVVVINRSLVTGTFFGKTF